MPFSLACLLAWLLGGIPFGLVLVRVFKGIDIRTIGSGNVGATNASRAFGPGVKLAVFLLIYVLDFAKGFVPAFFGPDVVAGGPAYAGTVLGAAAILGHCVSPFLKLKGGKGVATATGVAASLDWVALLIAFGAFGAVFGITRQVFLGSLALGIALATAIILQDPATAWAARLDVTIFGLAIAALLFFTHRSNIRELLETRKRKENG